MAVFMQNICSFNDCRMKFPTLNDLIYHIEYAHIEHDPVANQQLEASHPNSIPFSYALRFTSNSYIQEYRKLLANGEVACQIAPTERLSLGSGTPSGSEYEDDEMASPSENSNESWTTAREYSSKSIMEYVHRYNSGGGGAGSVDKPFACPVAGCTKRYKNVNGIKYHSKNGHKKDGKVRKNYRCHCGKKYINAQGLKNHSVGVHFGLIESLTSGAASAAVAQSLAQPLSAARATHSLVVTAYGGDPSALHYRGTGHASDAGRPSYRREQRESIRGATSAVRCHATVGPTPPAKRRRPGEPPHAPAAASIARQTRIFSAPPQLSQ